MTSSADNIFSPNNDTNRSMIVAILHRLEGSPAATETETASTLMTPRLTNGMQTQSLGRQKMVQSQVMKMVLLNQMMPLPANSWLLFSIVMPV